MTSFVLKLIGLCSMFCDHLGDATLGYFSYYNLIGRIAFPIFAFQIAQGYIHTKDLKKYIFRLLIFAIISQIPFMLFTSTFSASLSLNIGFTMILGVLAILSFDKIKNKYLGLSICVLISAIAQIIRVDYGAFGVTIILLFYIFRQNKLWLNISVASCIIINYVIRYMLDTTISFYSYYLPIIICCCISLMLIALYNGKRGPNAKYLFYVFYPAHLLFLYFLHYCIY